VARKCGPVSVGFSRLVTTLLGYLVLGTTEGKDTSFIPPKGGGLLSLFSHTDGKIRDGCGRPGGTRVRIRDPPNVKWRARRLATVLCELQKISDHL
jgi:hypothetical protein